QGAAAGRLPAPGVGRVRTRVTLLRAQLHDGATARVEQPPQLCHGRRVDKVLRVAEDDTGLGDGLQHGVGVAQGRVEHAVPVDVGGAGEAGERLLAGYVLAGARGGGGELVVAVLRSGQIAGLH